MSFNINNKLCFIDSFHFLSSSLGTFVKHFVGKDFTYLSQEFNTNMLDLVMLKRVHPYV